MLRSYSVIVTGASMPRFFFHLTSRVSRIPDDDGKEFSNLNDAYEHARKLVGKIMLYVGADDESEWKVVISNDIKDAQIIVPFPSSIENWSWQSTDGRAAPRPTKSGP